MKVSTETSISLLVVQKHVHIFPFYILIFLFLFSLCQDNVGGGGCDECKSGTFGLWRQNPAGCSPCFCFGVSSVCEELGGLVRAPVSTLSYSDLCIPKMRHLKQALLMLLSCHNVMHLR